MFLLKDIVREQVGEGGEGGSGGEEVQFSAQNWREFIPEEIREDKSLSSFTDVGALAKSYINAQSMIGKDKIVLPTTEDQWSETFQKLGRPESPDGYELSKVEGFEINEDAAGFFKGLFHSAGLNQSQVEKLYGGFAEHIKGAMGADAESVKQQMEEEDRQLHKEWGETYDSNFKLAERAAEEFGGEEFVKFLDESGYKGHPQMMKFLAKIGELNDEDNHHTGDGDPGLSPESIKAEIDEVMASEAYRRKDVIGHDAAVKKVATLFTRLHAGGQS